MGSLNERDIDLLNRIRQDLKAEPLPAEEIIAETKVDETIRLFFKNLSKSNILPGVVNQIWLRLTAKNHPEFDIYLSYSSNLYG